MKKLSRISFFSFFAILLACTGQKNDKVSPEKEKTILIEPRKRYIEGEVNDLLSSMRDPVQVFHIRAERDTLLMGKGGTTITIPANAFRNAKNQIVQGNVKIELIEALTVSDFLMHGLQTVSEDKILESGGMLFVDANQNGQPLIISPGKEIAVEVKSEGINPQMRLFSGDLSKGTVNWKNIGELESDYLVSIPLELLEFDICGWECAFSDSQIQSMKQPSLQDSYISTREFEERMCNLAFLSCDHYQSLDDDILKIYRDNSTKNLSYADSMVVRYFETEHRDLIDANYIKGAFKFDEKGWITAIYQSYVNFARQGLTKPLRIKGVDFNKYYSREELMKKGFSEMETDRIVSYQLQRKQAIQEKKDETEGRNIATYTFTTSQLGWVNVDAIMSDTSCKPSDLEVKIVSPEKVTSMYLSLVIPGRRVAVYSTEVGDHYSFTKVYGVLPIGEEAYVVAIGVRNGVPFFGKKSITIPKKGMIELKVGPSSKEVIALEVKAISEG